MHIATAKPASLRGFATAALAGAMIALAAIPMARADSAAAPTAAADSATVAQKASIPTTARDEEQTPEAQISREYLIKAAILFNFAKFASWPETAFSYQGAPLRICVLGEDPFGAALESLHGRQVRNRPLATARIGAIEDAPQCHILFVSASEEARLPAILDHVGKLPILTVADIGRFANHGGIIALKEVDNRSRIEINIGAAEQAGVKLSSKLLRLADVVSTQSAHEQPR
jgi:hypothetical protein